MTRDELVQQRQELFDELEIRKRLGDFDTNAKTTRLILQSLLALTQHLIDGMKR